MNRKGLVGIYDLKNKKLILDMIAQDIIIRENCPNFILYSTKESNTVQLFDVNKRKSTPTKMNYHFFDYRTGETLFKINVDSPDVYRFNTNGIFNKVDFYSQLDESYSVATAPDFDAIAPEERNKIEKQYFFPEAIKEKNPEVIREFNLNGINYVVFKVDNLLGVLNNTQKEIFIPADYQNIESALNSFILTKDNKKGLVS